MKLTGKQKMLQINSSRKKSLIKDFKKEPGNQVYPLAPKPPWGEVRISTEPL